MKIKATPCALGSRWLLCGSFYGLCCPLPHAHGQSQHSSPGLRMARPTPWACGCPLYAARRSVQPPPPPPPARYGRQILNQTPTVWPCGARLQSAKSPNTKLFSDIASGNKKRDAQKAPPPQLVLVVHTPFVLRGEPFARAPGGVPGTWRRLRSATASGCSGGGRT